MCRSPRTSGRSRRTVRRRGVRPTPTSPTPSPGARFAFFFLKNESAGVNSARAEFIPREIWKIQASYFLVGPRLPQLIIRSDTLLMCNCCPMIPKLTRFQAQGISLIHAPGTAEKICYKCKLSGIKFSSSNKDSFSKYERYFFCILLTFLFGFVVKAEKWRWDELNSKSRMMEFLSFPNSYSESLPRFLFCFCNFGPQLSGLIFEAQNGIKRNIPNELW